MEKEEMDALKLGKCSPKKRNSSVSTSFVG